MANNFDFDGTINANVLTSDGAVKATGICEGTDMVLDVSDTVANELTAILGNDIIYTG